jgi:hypothetical protein
MGVGKLAWQGFCFVYGVGMFGFMVSIAAWRDGAFTKHRKLSDEEKTELAAGKSPLHLPKLSAKTT